MKKTQKIQLGSMTVLVVALMQAGVVYAGISAPGIYIDTSAIPTFTGCSNSSPNPAAGSGCTATASGKTLTLAAPSASASYNFPGMSVNGNASAINTINFSGIVRGGGSEQAGLVFNTTAMVAFKLDSSSLIFGGNGDSYVSGANGASDNGAIGVDGTGVAHSTGGAGGVGGTGEAGVSGGNGGNGGIGVSGTNFSVDNSGRILGGWGGASGNGGDGGSANGGVGGGNLLGGSTTPAGNGGNGGAGGAGGNGGNGGNGGAGISGHSFSVTNTGYINGGAGGEGGVGGHGGNSNGGAGGAGGYMGSAGGTGGTGGAGGAGGNGGAGGAGVTGHSFTLINHGQITGGDGAYAGSAGSRGSASGGAGGVGSYLGGSGTPGTAGANGSAGVAGAGGIGVVSTGNATIINFGTISGGWGDGGDGARADAINLSGAGNTLELQAGSVINGNVISNAVTTVSGLTNIDGNFSNSGSVAIAVGTGGVTLQVNGDFFNSGVTTVSGYTEINGNFSNSGSVAIAAGQELYVDRDFNNTGTFTTVVTDNAYGKLVVDGTATLSGSKLFVDARTLTAANTYNGTVNGVIHADNLVGTFASYSDNSALFDFTPMYTGTDVNLTIAAASNSGFADAVTTAGNTAGRGAASALDKIIVGNPGGAIAAIFVPVMAGQESNAVSQTLPQIAGVVSQSVTTNLSSITRIVQSRQDGQQGRSSGDNFYGDQKFWFKPFGSWANQDSQNGVAGYKSSSYGMIFGADANLSDINRVGVAFAYSKTDINSKGVAVQNANVDSYTALVYGTHSLNASTELSAQAGIGLNNTSGGRTINIGTTNSRASSSYDSWSANIGVGLAHTMVLSEKTSFIPSIRVDYSRIRSDAYSETGAGVLNLNIGKNTSDALVLGADGKVSHAISNKATLVANLGVGYDFINDRSSLTSAFAGAPTITFATQGIDPSPWLVRGGFGVVGKVTQTMEVTARYDFEARRNFDNQTASVKARWMF